MDTKKIDSRIGDAAAKAKKGGHVLQETAEHASNSAKQLAVKVAHAGQETLQKVVDRAKEMASKASHHHQERAGRSNAAPK